MDTAQSAPVKMMRYNPGKFGRVKGTCVGCLDETSAEPLGWVVSASPSNIFTPDHHDLLCRMIYYNSLQPPARPSFAMYGILPYQLRA